MLTLIARGCNAILSRQRGVFLPLFALVQPAPDALRCSSADRHILSPRALAAVMRHRRP